MTMSAANPSSVLVDSHCHVDSFSPSDWVLVAARALAADVRGCLSAGVWWDELQKILMTHHSWIISRGSAKKHGFEALFAEKSGFLVFPSVGLHPMEVARRWRTQEGCFDEEKANSDIDNFFSVARQFKEFLWAIGETGYDASREVREGWLNKDELLRAQSLAFDACVTLSMELKLPVIVHSRSAWEITWKKLEQVKKFGVERLMIHCYGGPSADLKKLSSVGYLASFGGVMTWPDAKKMRESVRQCPSDIFLLETDSPDLSPVLADGRRPHRNEPAFLKDILQRTCELRGQSAEELIELNFSNLAGFFFGKD
ncbi:hypothetical protein EBU99_07365 [bacterium]|nr:hypothetical protein [bacterium]